MSGFAGVWASAGGSIDREAFERAAAHLAYRGPDVRGWRAPAVAIVCAFRAPAAEMVAEPLGEPATGVCVAFDGRLDNRKDLAADLRLRISDTTPDSSLVAAAYGRWGAGCALHLLGDFSLVVWDGRQRRLFAARDVAGVRPFFYRRWRDAWWWASDQRALVALDVPPINEAYVGEILCGRIASIDETIYRGVRRLPMGHAVIFGQATAHRWRYWRPDPEARLDYRDDRDYQQHFRALLKEAVRARLRLHAGAGVMLSGGIDSSSVAATVAELRRDGDRRASGTRAFSMVVPGSPACEGPTIRQVLARLGLPADLVPAREPPEAHFTDEAARALDLPESPSSGMMIPLYERAARRGCTVLLTGDGGDDWFEPSDGEWVDLLRGGRVRASCRWLADMAAVPGSDPWSRAIGRSLRMALPGGVRQIARTLLRRNPIPWWIEPGFANAHDLADRLRRQPEDVRFASIARHDIFQAATGGEAALRSDHDERCAAARGFEHRHPLMDRRLIEFALALPVQLRCRRGVTKAIMREAMSPLLPPSVTETPRNDDFGFLGLKVLQRLGGASRLATRRPVRWGWIPGSAVEQMYRMLQSGLTRYLWPLCAVTMIDYWLGALEEV